MRTFILVAVLTLVPGCFWVFDDRGKGDACDLPLAQEAVAEPAPLRNPENLTCQTFGPICDPECGPCPLAASQPTPTWGLCGSTCDSLTESACSADPACRVIKDVRCALGQQLCATDYLGCFPTDQGTDHTLDCFAAEDGTTCSMSNACVAMHRADCSGAANIPPECVRSFALCAPEGADPGRCHEVATCERLPPVCGSEETPGVANGCYTGACIPNDVCEPI
jgi:hypothetical protein